MLRRISRTNLWRRLWKGLPPSSWLSALFCRPTGCSQSLTCFRRKINVAVALAVAIGFLPNASFYRDSNGLPFDKYSIVAGRPWRTFIPTFGITHPAYTWGLYTAEDFALFHVKDEIPTRPVLVSAGRFPWNVVECDFIYWSDKVRSPFKEGSLNSFKSHVTVIQNCLAKKQRKAIGLLRFYMEDVLCARADEEDHKICVGQKGGALFCQNLFVGLLIRSEWCQKKTANFTDVGTYTNWLQSRVSDGHFIRLQVDGASARLWPDRIALSLCLLLTRDSLLMPFRGRAS